MSYPFDQFAAIAGANRQLFMKLLDIARTANERQAQIGSKVAAGFAEQIKEPKAAVTAPLSQVGDTFKQLEQSRQTVLAEAKSAFEEWRTETGKLISPETGQEQMALALQNWSKLVLAPFELLSKVSVTQASASGTPETKPAQSATTDKQG
ncbi:hypothetical protein [Sphingobium yanoikuyae]|uniref:hypothetical protein n=1 Tax=Sphingobium yanoikuyae TaxID=13690 RepID=UPI00241D7649|nr:hypothetical protein [Sphingobium yanoikuyae]